MVSFKFAGERPVLVVIGGFYRVSPSFYSFFPLWRTFRSSYDLNGRGRGGGKGGGGRRQRFTGLKWTFWSGHFSAISWPFVSRFLEILWDSLGFFGILGDSLSFVGVPGDSSRFPAVSRPFLGHLSRDSWRFFGILWDSWRFSEFHWGSRGFFKIPGHFSAVLNNLSREFLEILQDSWGFHGILGDSLRFLEIFEDSGTFRKDFTASLGISTKILEDS